MKILVPFVALTFAAGITFAQEESASPAESSAPATEEAASATVQETPATHSEETTMTPAPAPEKSPAAATKAEATKAASPAASPKKEAAANGAKPASSAAPAASKTATKNMTPRDAENAWEAAYAKHDVATVDGFLAADFTGVSDEKKFVDRSAVLSQFKKNKDNYKSAKNERLNVKMYGNNVAVVTGRARETGTDNKGKAFDRTYLFTDTWMMRGGKWQCIASHVSKIKG